MTKIKAIKTKLFRLGDLNPAPYNPRMIRKENKDGLRVSMTQFGCVEDIVVNIKGGKNVIVGGHQRYNILLEANGPKEKWPCKIVSLGIEDEKALNLALNSPLLQGEYSDNLPDHIKQLRDQITDKELFIRLRLDQLKGDLEKNGPDQASDGEAEFTREILEENNYLVFTFNNKLDWQVAQELFKLKTVQGLDSKKGYRKCGIGRVLSGEKLIKAVQGGKPDDFYTDVQKSL
jgi:hypothetical protein